MKNLAASSTISDRRANSSIHDVSIDSSSNAQFINYAGFKNALIRISIHGHDYLGG